jgi:hypothetical protein
MGAVAKNVLRGKDVMVQVLRMARDGDTSAAHAQDKSISKSSCYDHIQCQPREGETCHLTWAEDWERPHRARQFDR